MVSLCDVIAYYFQHGAELFSLSIQSFCISYLHNGLKSEEDCLWDLMDKIAQMHKISSYIELIKTFVAAF